MCSMAGAAHAQCLAALLIVMCVLSAAVECKQQNLQLQAGLHQVHQLSSLFLQQGLREERGEESGLNASLDEYLDQLMPLINSFIKTPIHLPEYNVSLHTDVAFVVPLYGSFKFYNGLVEDVGKITRSGSAPVSYDAQQLSVTLTVAVADVKFSGDFVAELESIGPSGSVSGAIDQLTVNLICTLDVKQLHVKINRLFLQAASVDVKLQVLPILDWFLNPLIDLIIYIIKWPLLAIISSQLRGDLQSLIDSYTGQLS